MYYNFKCESCNKVQEVEIPISNYDTAVGNLNSPKNKTPAQMQDDEPADYYDGDEYSEGLE